MAEFHARRVVVVALAASVTFAAGALADTFDGRITGTEHWQISPGGAAVDFPWAADWHIDPFLHSITLKQTVRLTAAGGSAAISGSELTDWESRIESTWNRPDIYMVSVDTLNNNTTTNWSLAYDITLSTAAGGSPDYTATVRDGAGSTDTSNWYRAGGSGVNRLDLNVAAHETGHYLANPDEYTNGGAIAPGSPFNALAFTTSSLMNNTNASGAGMPISQTYARHYWLWDQAMLDFFMHKGIEGKSITIVPTPAAGLLLGILAFPRRRRR